MQPGREDSFGQIKVPSHVNGKGQFKMDLSDAPIANLFSVNFPKSLWTNITSNLVVPDNFTSFLKHLTDGSDIHKHSLTLKAFNGRSSVMNTSGTNYPHITPSHGHPVRRDRCRVSLLCFS